MKYVKEEKRWHWWRQEGGKRSHDAVSIKQLQKKYPELVKADTKEGSESAAKKWWEDKLKALEADAVPPRPTRIRIATGEVVPIEVATRIHEALQRAGIDTAKLDAAGKAQLFQTLLPRLEHISEPEAPDPDKSITHHTGKYKKKAERDTHAGIIAPGRYQKIINSLDWYGKFLVEESLDSIDSIDADMLDAFYAWLHIQHKQKKLSIYTARDHWQVFRVWVQWLAEKRLIQLPLNINAKRFRFKLPKVKYRYWTAKEFQETYKAASDRMKLYLLLVANCGFYASDIAAIKKKVEFKPKLGVIERQRTKTGDKLDEGYESNSTVPTVKYWLWPETLKLLKEQLSDDPNICLRNEDGGPLWQDGITEDGRYFRNDNIASAYKRLVRDKLELEDPNTLENLRKSSAQFLSDSEYRDCANTFGGWSPRGVREKHYTEVSDERFKEALSFLRESYGFSS